jgi:ribosome-associated protein
MRQIFIHGDHIALGQLLKLAGFVSTGGEVKYLLMETTIRVNGEIDNRRGRKLYAGDVVAVEGQEPIRVVNEAGGDGAG